jgi:hypothetical protein
VFEDLLLRGPPPRRIGLQTRDNWDIPNEIGADPTDADVRKFTLMLQRFAGRWEPRKPPTGGYNCAGHVFANRRTAIFGGDGGPPFEEIVSEVLRRDGYRRLGPVTTDPAHVGDIVLYWMPDVSTPTLLHVGLVCELRKMIGVGDTAGVPHVLSKWDGGSGECLHHYRHVPYDDGDYTVEFWTDRPPVGGRR